MFSKQTNCSRCETSPVNRSARVLPQGSCGAHIGCACHSEESLPLGLSARDVPMVVHSRIVSVIENAVFHDCIPRPPHGRCSAATEECFGTDGLWVRVLVS